MTSYLLDSQPIETSLTGALAFRIRHRSYDLKGRPTGSTGLVIAPESAPADSPVLSWAYGTTGIGDAACPSLQPDPAGELRTYFDTWSTQQIDYGIPGAQNWINAGWVVVATDYQGLGTPGIHQYSVNRTNAIDAVTIVRAAREMSIGAGTRFGVTGWSQGGGTAAAVLELDAVDLDGLQLIGSVPMSPGMTIVGLEHPTGMGAALADPNAVPDGHLVMTLAAFAEAFPETLGREDMMTPLGIEVFDAIWNTQPVHHLSDTIGRHFKKHGPILAVNKEKMPAWAAAIKEGSAGRVKPICPVHVMIDGFADGSVIPVAWQQGYVDAIAALGADVTTTVYPDDDHFSLPASCVSETREWLTAQL
jgi:dienelactone hydrolase